MKVRKAGPGLITVVLITACWMTAGRTTASESEQPSTSSFAGIWSTHYQQTFITLILHADHTAYLVLLDQGHSIYQARWKPAPNGLIVNTVPRFRIWGGPDNDRVCAQMEPLPPDMTNDTMRRFPLSFYMVRSGNAEGFLQRMAQRPVPEQWTAKTPPRSFEQDAGRPRRVPR